MFKNKRLMSIAGGLAGIVLCSQAFAIHQFTLSFINTSGFEMCVSSQLKSCYSSNVPMNSLSSPMLTITGCNVGYGIGFLNLGVWHHFSVFVPCEGGNDAMPVRTYVLTRRHTSGPFAVYNGMTLVYKIVGNPTCLIRKVYEGQPCTDWLYNMQVTVTPPPGQ